MDKVQVTKIGSFIFIVCVMVMVAIYGGATEYHKTLIKIPSQASTYFLSSLDNTIDYFYYTYMDMHTFIFVGFSFMLAFSANIRFQAVGFSFFLCAYSLVYSNLWNALWYYIHNSPFEEPEYNIKYNIMADFAGLTLIITLGCLLGKVSFNCLCGIATLEVFFYFMNTSVIRYNFDASDVGESMCTHMFGALFGFTIACIVPDKEIVKEIVSKSDPTPQDRRSSLFSLFGTAVLFVFFPTLNGAFAPTADYRHRAFISTLLALTNSVMFTFPLSKLINGKFQPIDIQRATIAGGIVMGTCGTMMYEPYIPLILGAVVGCLTTIGLNFFKPFLDKKGLHDTCGVLWVNFLPGLIGAITGAIAMGENWGRLKLDNLTSPYVSHQKGFHVRTQLAAILLTIGISVGSGILVGIIVKITQAILPSSKLEKSDYFNDHSEWDLEEQEKEEDLATEVM